MIGKRHTSLVRDSSEINLNFQLKLMRLFGLWHDSNFSSDFAIKLFVYCKIIYLTIITLSILSMFYGLVHYRNDIASVCMIFSLLLSFTEVTFKIIDIYLHRAKIRHIIATILIDLSKTKILYGKTHDKIIQESLLSAKKFSKFYVFLVLSGGTLWSIEPVVDRILSLLIHRQEDFERTLPLVSWFPFNFLETPLYYLVYFHQILTVNIGTFVTAAVDVLFISLMIFTAAHIRLLGQSLEEIRTRPPNIPTLTYVMLQHTKESVGNGVVKDIVETHESESYKNLVACINHHKSLLRFAKDLESIISPVMILQFIATTLEICLAGFQAKMGDTMKASFLKFMVYVVTNIIQTFCYCKYGDNIIVESDKLMLSACNNDWYEGTEKFKKTLRILILRLQRPIIIWAGKFNTVSLETFSKMMHHSYSFFTLLSQMHE